MKRSKSLLCLALLAMVLLLGVGYAVVNVTNLSISGTAKVKESSLNVYFTGTPTTTGGATASVDDGALTATINVTNLTNVNDTATATYTIKNAETSLKAAISENTISNSNSTFFKVTTNVKSTPATIAANGTGTVTVTVELIKKPIEDADSTTNITVNLTATPVQP